jgi:hypothetical protein
VDYTPQQGAFSVRGGWIHGERWEW